MANEETEQYEETKKLAKTEDPEQPQNLEKTKETEEREKEKQTSEKFEDFPEWLLKSLEKKNAEQRKASENFEEFLSIYSANEAADLLDKLDLPFFSSKSIEDKKKELVLALQKANIDPVIFDTLLTTEVDRRLKVRFGVAFLFLTFLFTAASYAIIVLNSINKWDIPSYAITALIIETPIQFIGLLYIIARNLFPQTKSKKKKKIEALKKEEHK